MNLKELRNEYEKGRLDVDNVQNNPVNQFKLWFDDVLNSDFYEPNAMIVSSVNSENKPSTRVVLLKEIDSKGFVFYTNYNSRKGQELTDNPNAALLFYWDKLERQVRIEGKIEKVEFEQSDLYFQSRPYSSKIGAWASEQSQVLKSRFTLMRKVAKLVAQHPKHVPTPAFWGGFRVVPEYYEFWQGRKSRLHDRITYKSLNNSWQINRLYP